MEFRPRIIAGNVPGKNLLALKRCSDCCLVCPALLIPALTPPLQTLKGYLWYSQDFSYFYEPNLLVQYTVYTQASD